MTFDSSILLPWALAVGGIAWEWFDRKSRDHSKVSERLDKFCLIGRTRWMVTDGIGSIQPVTR